MRRMRLVATLISILLVIVAFASCGDDEGSPSPVFPPGDSGNVTDTGSSSGEDAPSIDGAPKDAASDAGQRCILASPDPDAGTGCIGEMRTLGDRPYCLHVPSSYQAGKAAPLVVLLHGYGATGQRQSAYFDFDALAERHGFVLAKPDGKINGFNQRYWNAFPACCAAQNDPGAPDDVAYVSDIVADLKSGFSIDAKRVYAVGHSNGGFMAHRLACDRSGTFAAVVSLAGAVDPLRCNPSDRVSVLQVHGDADNVISYQGGNTLGNPNPYPSVDTTLATWAQRNGCTGSRAKTGTADLVCNDAFPGQETVNETYAGCPPGIDVSLSRIVGGSHIPSFLVPPWAEHVWSFLEAHPKP